MSALYTVCCLISGIENDVSNLSLIKCLSCVCCCCRMSWLYGLAMFVKYSLKVFAMCSGSVISCSASVMIHGVLVLSRGHIGLP